MDLSLNEEHVAFQREVEDFLSAHADKAPGPNDRGLKNAKRLAWQKRLIEHGYAARTIPKAYGGFGAAPDILKSRIIAEAFAKARVSTGLAGQGISMLVPTLLECGTEAQKEAFIKPTLLGEIVWCQGYSEPGAGSDLASLSTRAHLDGDDYVINGQKIWTSTAQQADMMFCLVRTEPDARKHAGISYLVFSMATPGIEVRPLVDMTGAANFNEVFFTDVRVPTSQIGRGPGDPGQR
ncbi:MAG: acyl-CoA dehydrogenase family protein, partial [Pseudomonadota bacterium]